MLLLLDNCEHVIEQAANLAQALLDGTRDVSILATSREPLRVAGEHEHRLGPLGIPQPSPTLTAAEAAVFPAVELFVERATAVVEDFALTDANAPLVVRICRGLDGLPLAIEFAAPRVQVLGVEALAARLESSLPLLRARPRTAMPRHRTMRSVLNWSYGLLTQDEQAFFRALGIFAGGFTIEAAAAVATEPAPTPYDAIDRLADLVAKSLIVAEVSGASPRFRLLDTTRAYTLDRLDANNERDRLAHRHADYYCRLFESAEGEAAARPPDEWLAHYAPELDNLRAALDWTFWPGGDAAIGVALTAAAVPVWTHMALMVECRRRAEQALAAIAAGAAGDQHCEMKLYVALTHSLRYSSDAAFSEIGTVGTKALELAESMDNVEGQLRSLLSLWAFRFSGGQHRAALTLAQRFDTLAVKRADPSDRLIGHRMIGVTQYYLGELRGARRHLERALAPPVAPNQKSQIVRVQVAEWAVARDFLARVLWLQGLPDQAMRTAESSVAEARAANHVLSLGQALAVAACPIALWNGDLAAAEHYVEMLLDHSTRHAAERWRAFGRCYEGMLVIRGGDVSTGLRLLRTALSEPGGAGSVPRLISFLVSTASDHARQIVDGLPAVEEAVMRSERTEERWLIAEFLRLSGELLLSRGAAGSAAAAEGYFRKALDVARQQQALSWELRAATSLARLLRDRGRAAEALDALRPVYDRLTEGFDTADLLAAKGLLQQLHTESP
jgi:predicted ATPase